MIDSGWGTWNELLHDNMQQFYCRTVSSSPTNENGDIGIEEYSDSIKFEKINEKWIKTSLTPEGFVYRKKNVVFGE